MNPYDQAIKFLESGIGIIPVTYKDKRPAAWLLPAGEDGSPTWEPYTTHLPSIADVKRWFAQPMNYGVVCGWYDIAVLDFDDIGEYTRWSMWCARQGGTAEDVYQSAYQVQTARGVHVYIRQTTERKNRKIGKIDFKVKGYVLGPGSIHPSGSVYRPIRSGFIVPVIGALSDILPAALLSQTVAFPKVAPVVSKTIDPWQAVNTAATIAPGAIDKIKKHFKLEDFLGSLTPTSADRRWQMTCCPLHDDQNPSMWVDTHEQICGCFSGCTPKPLDVINLYARLHGLSNRDAMFILSEMS